MLRHLRFPLVLMLLAAPVVRADDPNGDFFFKKGDRVVFLGDSITEQYQYSSYIELYLTTRFPTWKMTFINAGISGDTANGGAKRFQSHVLDEKPTAVTINFGMNDGGYGKFNEGGNKTYRDKTAVMLEMAKKAGVRVALLSPNAVDRRISPKFSDFKIYLETQKQFYAPLKEIAAKHDAVFVDQYATTRAGLEKMEADDPDAKKVRPYGDGFHTSEGGGLHMAYAILTGLKAPALVSDVAINAATGDVNAKGCTVDKIKGSTKGGSIERIDEALPLPVQKAWLPVLPYVNNLKDFNWYGLKVTNLDEGKYTLLIDGKEIATFSDAELAKGVNVGNVMTGPIYEQGQKVLAAINAKNQQVHKRFRGVVMKNDANRAEELAKRQEKIDALQTEIYTLARPVAHPWELRRKE
jgi:lysophospholipase L1-like esterase